MPTLIGTGIIIEIIWIIFLLILYYNGYKYYKDYHGNFISYMFDMDQVSYPLLFTNVFMSVINIGGIIIGLGYLIGLLL